MKLILNICLIVAQVLFLDSDPLSIALLVGTVLGQTIGGLLQEKPDVPQFRPIDTTKEQLAAVRGNIANFADISKMAGATNAFNQEQLNQMLESAVPGYRAMVQSIGGKINSFLSGELPADVSSQVGRNAAYRSLSGGYGGSGMARNLVARDLGLTSLDLISKGIDAGSRWIATAKANTVAPQFDVSSMFISPQQRIQTQMWNREGKFARDWLDSQIDAEYSFGTILGKAIQSTDQQVTQAAMSMVGSAAGGAI